MNVYRYKTNKPYTVQICTNKFEGTNHFHLLLPNSDVEKIYRFKEKLVWGPKVKSVGEVFPLLLGPLERSFTVVDPSSHVQNFFTMLSIRQIPQSKFLISTSSH